MKTSRVRALCARPARSGILALTAAAIVGGCAQEAPVAVAPVEIDRGTTCSLDGMILMDYPGPKAQIHYDRGPPDVFCDTVEMFSIYLKPEQQRRVRALFVQDMARADWNNPVDHWIDARTAFYVVGSKRHGSMGPTLASFSRETDARDFAAKEGGKVYRFEQITPDMVVLDGGVLKDRMT